MRSDGLDVCAVAGEVHGLVMLGMGGALDELLALLRRVERLKYHVGALKVVPGALGVERLRTSSSWYPCRS